MVFEIEGTHCIVTGGASGIGLCYVKELLKNGAAYICILDLNPVGYTVVDELNKEIGQECTLFLQTDVSDAEQFVASVKSCIDVMKTLDIFINNAGILNDKKWELQIAINLNAVIRGTFLALQYMGRDQGGNGGLIVNVASVLGLDIASACPIYCATKHAIVALSRSWGLPYHYDKTGVRILTMCPGVTDTPLISNAHKCQSSAANGIQFQEEIKAFPIQSPNHVAEGMITMIRTGESGSVWVVEENKPLYEVGFSDKTPKC